MNDLIERIEAASGPDRELDAEIAREIGRIPPHAGYAAMDDVAWDRGLGYSVPAYTTSIDAALTLVPEGWTIFHFGGPFNDSPSHATVAGGQPIAFCEGDGATPALAICAAALKSRAYLKETNNAD